MGLGKFDYSKVKYVPNDFFDKMERGKVRNGDILLYKDGAYVGRKTYFDYDFPFDKCCVNEHVFILRTNELVTPKYLFFWLDQKWVTNILINMSLTSAQPGLNQQSLKTVPILIPEKQVAQRFDKTIEPFIALIFMNAKEAHILEQIRDVLLPKLLSGEIRVKLILKKNFQKKLKSWRKSKKKKLKLIKL
jgi:type I restriction enzyme S subunit